jgi:methylated-DNA-protein-cysteine methyltransferase related protein
MPAKTVTRAYLRPATVAVIAVIRSIPHGKVATYGQVAALAGDPRGARQVARILHSCSATYKLPWQRVLGAGGRITLPRGAGFEEQALRLEVEGVMVTAVGRVPLSAYGWSP